MVLVNGVAVQSVPAGDRGLAYGDGVFRTMRLVGGRPRWWRDHYRKLVGDCAALGIECPAAGTLAAEIEAVAREHPEGVAKVIVTRGAGERGYAPPPAATPTRIVMSAPLPAYRADFAAGIRVHLCATRLALQPRLAGIKHLNRLENVLARSEWHDETIAEGLMLDTEGYAVSGTMTNLFIADRGGFTTADLSRCGVAGVARERILDAAARHGTACRVERIPLERLLEADEVVLVNSVVGVWPVRECFGRTWRPGPTAARMRQWLDEAND
jgi:4-amino-4-deoxychorismate lyase